MVNTRDRPSCVMESPPVVATLQWRHSQPTGGQNQPVGSGLWTTTPVEAQHKLGVIRILHYGGGNIPTATEAMKKKDMHHKKSRYAAGETGPPKRPKDMSNIVQQSSTGMSNHSNPQLDLNKSHLLFYFAVNDPIYANRTETTPEYPFQLRKHFYIRQKPIRPS